MDVLWILAVVLLFALSGGLVRLFAKLQSED